MLGYNDLKPSFDNRGWTRWSGPSVPQPCKQKVLLLPLSSRELYSTVSKAHISSKYQPIMSPVVVLAACPVDSYPVPVSVASCRWSPEAWCTWTVTAPPIFQLHRKFLIAIKLSSISTSFWSVLQNFSSPNFYTQQPPTPTSPRRCLTRFWTQSWLSRERHSSSRSTESRFARRHAQGATSRSAFGCSTRHHLSHGKNFPSHPPAPSTNTFRPSL